MKVLIDGIEIEVKNDVKVIHEGYFPEADLHLTLTHEGIIGDMVQNGEVIYTGNFDYSIFVDELKEN